MADQIVKFLLVTITSLVAASHVADSWTPRDDLSSFWALNSILWNWDDGQKRPPSLCDKSDLLENELGPFGKKNTSFSVKETNSYLCRYNNTSLSASFTLAFHLNPGTSNTEAGILAFANQPANGPEVINFGVRYKPPTGIELYSQDRVFANVPVLNVTQWNFIFITGSSSSLSVYSREYSGGSNVITVDNATNIGGGIAVALGYGKPKKFDPSHKLACVFYYNATLDVGQMVQLENFCNKSAELASNVHLPNVTPLVLESTTETTQSSSKIEAEPLSTIPTPSEKTTPKPKIATVVNAAVGGVSSLVMAKMIPELGQAAEPTITAEKVMKACNHFNATLWSPPSQFPEDPSKPMPIIIGFAVDQLNYLSNTKEAISVSATMVLEWHVGTCKKNSTTMYSGNNKYQRLRVGDPTKVWRPPMIFLNNEQTGKTDTHEDFLVVEDPATSSEFQSFSFYWIFITEYTARCSLDLTQFPFDHQKCYFEFLLNRADNLIAFSNPDFTFSERALLTTEWTLTRKIASLSRKKLAGMHVSRLVLLVEMDRKPGYYLKNLYVPACALASLLLVAFMLPPNLIHRPLLTVTIVLAITVAQGNVLDFIPKKTDVNLMSQFVDSLFWLSIICVMYNSAALWLVKSAFNEHGLTRKSPRLFKGKLQLARFLDICALAIALAAFVYANLRFFTIV